ncbi:hypothetical protein OT109_15520 [Phycisphaeraceae bacterium D3-23]
MQGKTPSKHIACGTLALLGLAATGCSTSTTQQVEAVEPIEAIQLEPTEYYTGHALYEAQPPQMFSLVATDYVGFIAFADTMVAWSLEAPESSPYDSVVVVE